MPNTLQVVYSRSHSIGGIAIRFLDRFGQWSHCGIVSHEGTVIEAVAFKGVIETPLVKYYARYAAFHIVQIPCDNPEGAIEFARSQIGKPYDYWGAIGIAVRRKSWSDEDAWQCSELVEASLKSAGRTRFRNDPAVITPNISFMVQV